MRTDLITPRIPADITNTSICTSLEKILSTNILCSIASTDSKGTPHINTCFYSFSDDFKLYIFTDPATKHSKNINARSDCAVNIFSSAQVIGDDLCGTQLFGIAKELNLVSGLSAFHNYCSRFPIILTWADSWDIVLKSFKSRFFEIQIKSGKILDEVAFGKEQYVSFEILKG